MILKEGLRAGDLEHLVIDTISIDEFESKLDQDAITVAFFCRTEEVAYELTEFVEHGLSNILDVEVSPAPNKDGLYLAFIEIKRTKKFPEIVVSIAQNISLLTEFDKWKFTAYKMDGTKPLTENNIEINVRLTPQEEKDLEDKTIEEFINRAGLKDYLLENRMLTITRPNGSIDRFKVFRDPEHLIESIDLGGYTQWRAKTQSAEWNYMPLDIVDESRMVAYLPSGYLVLERI